MLRYCTSLQVAMSVVGILQTMLDEDRSYDAYIECSENCREQGLIIRADGYLGRFAIVTQARGSDQIVVYFGDTKDGLNDNRPNDATWKRAKYFSYKDYHAAAKFMYEFLFNGIRSTDEE